MMRTKTLIIVCVMMTMLGAEKINKPPPHAYFPIWMWPIVTKAGPIGDVCSFKKRLCRQYESSCITAQAVKKDREELCRLRGGIACWGNLAPYCKYYEQIGCLLKCGYMQKEKCDDGWRHAYCEYIKDRCTSSQIAQENCKVTCGKCAEKPRTTPIPLPASCEHRITCQEMIDRCTSSGAKETTTQPTTTTTTEQTGSGVDIIYINGDDYDDGNEDCDLMDLELCQSFIDHCLSSEAKKTTLPSTTTVTPTTTETLPPPTTTPISTPDWNEHCDLIRPCQNFIDGCTSSGNERCDLMQLQSCKTLVDSCTSSEAKKTTLPSTTTVTPATTETLPPPTTTPISTPDWNEHCDLIRPCQNFIDGCTSSGNERCDLMQLQSCKTLVDSCTSSEAKKTTQPPTTTSTPTGPTTRTPPPTTTTPTLTAGP